MPTAAASPAKHIERRPEVHTMATRTGEKDLVLIFFEDQPLTFARIETITADHKPGWYHVKLLMLQTPLQVVTWILREVYIDGTEFTMNGKRMRLEKVICPEEPAQEVPEEENHSTANKPPAAKVISLADLKKN